MTEFSVLNGKTLIQIDGMQVGSERVTFWCADGSKYCLHHSQDCCESVDVNDIDGDPSDLIGSPLVLAEVSTSENATPAGVTPPEFPDSYTWTFYRLATQRGYVTIRWLGESNGYYSEEVSFYCDKEHSA